MDLELAVRLVLAACALTGAALIWRQSRSGTARFRAGEAFAQRHGTSVSARMAPMVDALWFAARRRALVGVGVLALLVLVLPLPTAVIGLVLACTGAAAVSATVAVAVAGDLTRLTRPSEAQRVTPRVLSVDDYLAPWRRIVVVLAVIGCLGAAGWSLTRHADALGLALAILSVVLAAALAATTVAARRALAQGEPDEPAEDRFVRDALRSDLIRQGYAAVAVSATQLLVATLVWAFRDEFPVSPPSVLPLVILLTNTSLLGLGPESQYFGTPRFRRRLWPDRDLVYSPPVLPWRP